MSKSILQDGKFCFVCGANRDLHRHHIFYGTSNRKQSEKYGCWVYLCPYHHNMSDHGVHFDKKLDTSLKVLCQLSLKNDGWSKEKFIEVFGRSYI